MHQKDLHGKKNEVEAVSFAYLFFSVENATESVKSTGENLDVWPWREGMQVANSSRSVDQIQTSRQSLTSRQTVHLVSCHSLPLQFGRWLEPISWIVKQMRCKGPSVDSAATRGSTDRGGPIHLKRHTFVAYSTPRSGRLLSFSTFTFGANLFCSPSLLSPFHIIIINNTVSLLLPPPSFLMTARLRCYSIHCLSDVMSPTDTSSWHWHSVPSCLPSLWLTFIQISE